MSDKLLIYVAYFWVALVLSWLAEPWFRLGMPIISRGYNNFVERQFSTEIIKPNDQYCKNWSYLCSQEYEECKK